MEAVIRMWTVLADDNSREFDLIGFGAELHHCSQNALGLLLFDYLKVYGLGTDLIWSLSELIIVVENRDKERGRRKLRLHTWGSKA